MIGKDARSELGEWKSFGRYPVLREVLDYYLREDISEVLFGLMRTRRVLFKWGIRETSKIHSEEVVSHTAEQLRNFIEKPFKRLSPETRFNRYPHFESRAARYEERQRGGAPFGYDFFFESDGLSLRDNFSKLGLVLDILESYGVPYLAKFSGNTSLHVIIPAEAFPKEIDGEGVVANWHLIDSSIASYLRAFGKTQIDHEPSGTLPYSLSRKTGLVSLPLRRGQLKDFEPWMANIHLIERARVPSVTCHDVTGDAVESTRRFLDDVLAWREPQKKLKRPWKQKAWKFLNRQLRQVLNRVNSKPVEFWIDLLNSKRESDRVNGAWSLLWHKDREKMASIIEEHLGDACPDVRYYLIVLMKGIGPDRFPRRLKEVLVRAVRDRHEIMALEDLLVLDKADGLSVTLSSLLKKLDRWGVQMEASVLRRMGLSRDVVHDLLLSPSIGIRLAMAMALGKMGNAYFSGPLEAMLEDPSREIRLAAISSLGLIGEASSIKALSRMLERQAISVRKKAIQALSRISDVEALRIICSKVLKGDLETRREAVRVLVGRPGELVRETLLTAIKDKNPRVRLDAMRLLLYSNKRVAIQAKEALQTEGETLIEAENLRKKLQVEHVPPIWSLNNI